ncbi:hypothetical protein Tco_0659028 [Tanacetum coccineum]
MKSGRRRARISMKTDSLSFFLYLRLSVYFDVAPLLPFRCYLILGVLHSICREMPLSDATPTIRCFAERRGLCPPSGAAPGETSCSVPLHDSSLGVADYQVSTLVLSGDGVPAGKPPVAEIHDDLFDTSVLDKPDDA